MKTSLTLLAVAALLPAAGAQSPLLTIPSPYLASNSEWGSVVAGIGDVNGDGHDDFAVTDIGSSMGGFHAGMARLFSGADGAVLQTFTGVPDQHFGTDIAGLGDVDGDGGADLVIGAFSDDTFGQGAGAAFLCTGASGAGLKVFYGAAAGDNFGAAVCAAGDLDFDGIQDVAISSPMASFGILSKVGGVRVHSSATGAVLLSLKGSSSNGRFGETLDGAGDVNGDGMPDLIVGIPNHNAGVGRIEVRSGSDGHVLFGRDGVSDGYGRAVAGLGDVNGDGFADVAVGAPLFGNHTGRVEVLLGPTGTLKWTFNGNAVDDDFGVSVSGLGDVDKDGFADILASANGSPFDFGYARVFSGRTGGVLYATVYGDAKGDVFGSCVAGVGDTNGDGWVDIAVGADDDQAGIGYVRTYEVLMKAPNLGGGGPGSATLSMYGSPLTSFGEMDLALKGAAPNKPAFLIASLGTLNAPLKGGVLVPNIGTGLLVMLATDAQGKVLITGVPGGNGPLSLYVQCLVKDPAQPKGWAFSNAIKPQILP